jgi:hypothetical protein
MICYSVLRQVIKSSRSLLPSNDPFEVRSLLASPPEGRYESVVTVHEAAFAIYGFRKITIHLRRRRRGV